MIQERLIDGLGLDIASEWSGVVTTNAAGTSRGRIEVRAEPPATGETGETGETGSASDTPQTVRPLVLSFGVGIETEAHPCATPSPQPPAQPSTTQPPVAAIASDGLLVSHGLLERVIAAGHQAGQGCGDQLAQHYRGTAGDLVEFWPELSRLDPASAISTRLWPLTAPALAFNEERAVASTNDIQVDIYAEIDGARVRVGSFVASAEVSGPPIVSDGWLMLEADSTVVTSVNLQPGLFGEPPSEFVEALATQIVDRVLDRRPLIPVPVRGATDPKGPLVSQDGYLIVPRD